MSHVFFNPDSVEWSGFLESQEGGGKFFAGTKYQRGFGVLGSIGRFILPIAKNLAQTLATSGLETGQQVLKDYTEGRDVKEALMTHGKQSLQSMGRKLQQCGKGKTPTSTIKNRKHRDQLSY
jgi:hypothetical protein